MQSLTDTIMCKEETCKCKEVCTKMQKAGLRKALIMLKKCNENTYKTSVIIQLDAIQNILNSYECLPAKCLIPRINYIKLRLNQGWGNRMSEKMHNLHLFICELEALLDNIHNK